MPGEQLPAPSQVGAVVSVLPVHEGLPHIVPRITKRHAPAPSHMPSRPHIVLPVAQLSCASVPAIATAHLPEVWPVSVVEQAMQLPVQALSQQTWSTQK